MTDNTQELDEILNEVTSFDVYKHPEYIEEAKQAILDWHTRKLNEARIDEIKRVRPYLTYPGMVYYGERMNELRADETEEI